MKIIAAIEEPTVIAQILAHLGLPTRHLRCATPASLAVRPACRSLLNRSSPTSFTTPGFPSIRNSLIPNQQRLQPGSVLIRVPLWPSPLKTAKFVKIFALIRKKDLTKSQKFRI